MLRILTLKYYARSITIESGTFGSCSNLEILKLHSYLESAICSEVVFCSDVFSGSGKLRCVFFEEDTLVNVRGSAFRNQTGLEFIGRVDLENVRIYGTDSPLAFAGCTNLKSVYLGRPDSSELVVYESMFEGSGVTMVSTFNPLTIQSKAFRNCEHLVSILHSNPDEVVEIVSLGDNAFAGCTVLDKVNAKLGKTSDAIDAFAGCIRLHDARLSFCEIDSVLPNGLFSGCIQLFKVVVDVTPVSKLSASPNVFQGCSQLEQVEFTGSTKCMIRLSENVFGGCDRFRSITFDNDEASSPLVITNNTFRGLPALEGIYGRDGGNYKIGIEGDGAYAFSGCISLKGAVLAGSTVYEHMFEGSGIVSAPMLEGQTVIVHQNAFANCSKLLSFCLPNPVVLDGADIFAGCSSLGFVVLDLVPEPNMANTIPNGTFAGCSSLSDLEIKTWKLVLDTASFASCTALESVHLSVREVTVCPNVFSAEGSLEGFFVGPDTQVIVQNNAFRNQVSLKGIYVDESSTEDACVVGDDAQYAFAGCTNLLSIRLSEISGSGPIEIAQSMFEGSGLTILNIDGEVMIQQRAFAGCTKLKSISGDVVGTLADSSFEGCTALSAVNLELTACPSNVNAFAGCTKLGSVSIVCRSDLFLSPDMFSGCIALSDVEASLSGEAEKVSIGEEVFRGCNQLKTVKLFGPVYYLTLDDNSFTGCESLISIGLPDQRTIITAVTMTNTSVRGLPALEYIGDSDGRSALISLSADGNYAFANCTSLRSVYLIGDTIYSHMFEGSGLVSAPEVNGSDVTVYQNAFANCSKLKTFRPSYDVSLDGIDIFAGCSYLDTVALDLIPKAGEADIIPNGTFAGCSSLRYLGIGTDRLVFDTASLASCTALESVYVSAKEVTVCPNVFSTEGVLKGFFVDSDTQVVVQNNAFRNQVALKGVFSNMAGTENACVVGDDAQYAFAGCINMRSIRLSDTSGSTTFEIAPSMFEGSGLVSAPEVNGSAVVIHQNAFANCSKLESFSPDYNIFLEGTDIFAGCSSLRTMKWDVTQKDGGIDSIPNGTFTGCTRLNMLEIISGKFVFDTASLASCTALESVYVSAKEVTVCPNVFSGEGVLKGFFVDPETQVVVQDNAFRNQSSLRGIFSDRDGTGDARVKGDNAQFAFAGCTNLQSILLSDSVRSGTIEVAQSMFEGSGIVTLEIDNKVDIQQRAFAGCVKLRNMPDMIEGTVADSSFEGCTSLPGVTLLLMDCCSNVNAFAGCIKLVYADILCRSDFTFHSGMFSGCMALSEVNIKMDGGTKVSFGEEMFRGCSQLRTLELTGTVSVLTLDDNVFTGCEALTHIRLPDQTTPSTVHITNTSVRGLPSLKSIGDNSGRSASIVVTGDGRYAFANCTSLVSVKLEGDTVYEHMFDGSGIISAPESGHEVVKFYQNAFANCSRLEAFVPGYAVELWGIDIFSGCSVLGQAILSIPLEGWEGAFTLPNGTFMGCSVLKELKINLQSNHIVLGTGAFASCGILGRVTVDGADTVTVGPNAFSAEGALKEFRVGNDAQIIVQESAFRNQIGLKGLFAGPSGTENAKVKGDNAQYAFAGCTNLHSIRIHGDDGAIVPIPMSMFEGSGLVDISFDNEVEVFDRAFAGCTKLTQVNGYVTGVLHDGSFEGCTSLSNISIDFTGPSPYNNVFAGCTGLTKVKIRCPSSFEVSSGLFSGCTKLYDVQIELTSGNGELVLGDEVFRNCVQLRTVKVSGAEFSIRIADSTFAGCELLASIELPDQNNHPTEVSLTNSSLRNLPSLRSVGDSKGNSATFVFMTVGDYAFAGCTNLRNVKLYGDTIWDHMFEGSGLVSAPVLYGDRVVVEDRAFSNCTKMKEFSSAVPLVFEGSYVFSGCTSLESVDLSLDKSEYDTVCSLPDSTFTGCGILKNVTFRAIPDGFRLVTGLFGSCSMTETVVVLNSDTVTVCPNVFATSGALKNLFVENGTQVVVENNAFRNQTSFLGVRCTVTYTDAPVVGDEAEYAFAGCTALRSVLLGDDTVYAHMFEGSGLVSAPVSYSSNVSLHQNAFASCTGMREFKPTYAVSFADMGVFAGCSAIRDIDLTFTVKTDGEAVDIPNGTFSGCTALRTVRFDASFMGVTLETESFASCPVMNTVTIVNSHDITVCPNVFSTTGALKDFLVDTDVNVKVENNAFRGQTALTGIHIVGFPYRDAPVVSLDAKFAFSGCSSFRSVFLSGDGLESEVDVAESMFEGSGLQTLRIDNRVVVGERAFANCTKLTSVNDGIHFQKLYPNAFTGCTQLSRIDFKVHDNDEADNAFSGCTRLSRVSISMDDGRLYLAEGMFSGCSALTDVTIKLVTSDDTADVVVGSEAFRNCTHLSSLTIVGDKKCNLDLKDNVFFGCELFTNVILPNQNSYASAVKITNTSFRNLTRFKGVTDNAYNNVPITVVGDGRQAFAGCTSLESVRLSDGHISENMFEGSGITSAPAVDDNALAIEDSAFSNCIKLRSFRPAVPVTFTGTYVFSGCTKLDTFDIVLTKGEYDESCMLPNGTFTGCNVLKKVVIDTGLEKLRLDTGLFGSCSLIDTVRIVNSDTVTVGSNVFASSGALRDFIVDGGVKVVVEDNAFRNLNYLTGIHCTTTTPNDAPIVGHDAMYAFSGCTNFRSALIYFDDPVGENYIAESMFEGSGLVSVNIYGPVILKDRAFANCSYLTRFVNDGAELTLDGMYVFMNCNSLRSLEITLGAGAETYCSIPDGTFTGCELLKSLTVHVQSKVLVVDSGTFGSCSNLESVTVEGATGVTFGSNAFSSSGKLRTVDVDTYVTVHENAFRGQTGLESIAHGSADAPVRGFDALSAFAGCTALRSVLIDSPDEGVVTVHESMFDGSGITKVVFGKPVSIKARAFSGCDRLVHVEGAAIAEMKENAFAGCVRLETLDATVGDLSEADNAFSGCTRLCEVHLVADALPECVLPNGMFSGCSLLVGVTVDLRGDSSRSPSVLVSPTAFQNCSQLVSVEFLNTSSGTVYFSDNAFSGCSLLADVVVGDASQEHPVLATKNAFRGLPSLVGVHAYDGSDAVVEIDGDGAYAFAGCTALRSVSLAGDTVYEHMFEGSGLVSAPEMASADVAVHQNAFANCSKMKEFSPAYSVAIVGIGAFEGCPSVEEMDLHF
ncbi:MAG: leucine-rich repeat domain-containing protein, partial [archaeon]|nr:leucine-rich repeat domain-containing protein [archaeon]